jgi:hypothetical protein
MALQPPAVYVEPITQSPTARSLCNAATGMNVPDGATGGGCRGAARPGAQSYGARSFLALAADPQVRHQRAWLELTDVVRRHS